MKLGGGPNILKAEGGAGGGGGGGMFTTAQSAGEWEGVGINIPSNKVFQYYPLLAHSVQNITSHYTEYFNTVLVPQFATYRLPVLGSSITPLG